MHVTVLTASTIINQPFKGDLSGCTSTNYEIISFKFKLVHTSQVPISEVLAHCAVICNNKVLMAQAWQLFETLHNRLTESDTVL